MDNNISKDDLIHIIDYFSKTMPNRECPLYHVNEYTFLIAIILSARAMDRFINTVTPALFSKVQNPYEMINLGYDNLCNYINRVGLWRNKSKYIMAMSNMLIEKYDGKVPDNYHDLILLPGVGRKTADVLLNYWFNKPTIPVDTHVFRVAQKIGITIAKTPDELSDTLYNIIPKEYHIMISHWLVAYGRNICKAPRPLCKKCEISQWCKYYKQYK